MIKLYKFPQDVLGILNPSRPRRPSVHFSTDETGRVKPGGFHGNVPPMLDVNRVKEEPGEDSLSAEGER